MVWLRQCDHEIIRYWLRNMDVSQLVTKPTGEIVWANEKFESWSKYSLPELLEKTWIELLLDTGEQHLDKLLTQDLVDGFRHEYSCVKFFIPKNSSPQAVRLRVIRYPLTGPLEYCLVTAQEITQDSSETHEIRLHLDSLAKSLNLLVQAAASADADEANLMARLVIKWLKTHPRIAALLGVILIYLIFGDAAIGILDGARQLMMSFLNLSPDSPSG